MSNKPIKEPAVESYFFGKGYRDLRAIIANGTRRNFNSAKYFFAKIPGWNFDKKEEFWRNIKNFLLSCIFFTSSIATLIFGNLLLVIASLVHGGILCAITAIFYCTFNFLWTIERVYLSFRAFFMACPNCHAHNILPEYLCDRCGAVHTQLLPNSYGIFIHHCKCGNRLPATVFLNRGKIQARCPSCHHRIAREHVESTRIFIPVVGGPSVGKSAFLFNATCELIEGKAANLRFQAKPFDQASANTYKSVAELLKTGKPPDKTTDSVPQAFNLTLYSDNKQTFLLYLYDPAGEAYQSSNHLSAHRFNNYLSGMILIIDPFAIRAVRERYAVELKREQAALKPSELPIEDSIDYLLLSLEANFSLAKADQIQAPLAVVLNKIDAFDLEEIIGETAVKCEIARWTNGLPPSDGDVRNKLLKTQLIAWNEQAFVQRVEARFSKVRYFTCSALGRMPDSSTNEFRSNGVLPPLLWIFDQVINADFINKIGNIHSNLRFSGIYRTIGIMFITVILLTVLVRLTTYLYGKIPLALINTTTISIQSMPFIAENLPTDSKLRINIGAGVLLRDKPTRNSRSKGVLGFGVVVTELKQEVQNGTLWSFTQLLNGKQAWILAEFLTPFTYDQSALIYLQIIRNKLTSTNKFGDLVEVNNLLSNLVQSPKFANNAEFSTLIQQALEKTYRAIPSGQKNRSPYKEWLSANR